MTPKDEMTFIGYRKTRRQGKVVWVANPLPLVRPQADEVHVSCTFTWDRERAEHLASAWGEHYPVRIGGPAVSGQINGFTPGRYIRSGVTFTSRGCNNDCPWCLVPEREGPLVESADFPPGNIVEDNNLLQCSDSHQERVWAMLRQKGMVYLSGGLDPRLLTVARADMIRGLRVRQLFLASDTTGATKHVRTAVRRLAGLARRKLRCYVMIGYGTETISEATARLEDVWAAGCMPFAQLYQPPDQYIRYPPAWRALAREWSRPAAMMANHGGR